MKEEKKKKKKEKKKEKVYLIDFLIDESVVCFMEVNNVG